MIERKSLMGVWSFWGALGQGSCAGAQEHPAGPHAWQGEWEFVEELILKMAS